MTILKSQKAVSSVELAALVIIILAALLAFSGYIQRAIAGRWKATGDAYGQSKQYDPRGFGAVGENGGTMDCFLDTVSGRWIDEDLYRNNGCDCTGIRGDGSPLPEYAANCTDCKVSSACANPPS